MKKNNVVVIVVLSALISFICGTICAYFIVNDIFSVRDRGGNKKDILYSIPLHEDSSIHEAVEKVYDATVVVEGFKDNAMNATGTGFVYKKDDKYAYIMTNHHVVSSSDKVRIVLSNDMEMEAEVKGSEVYSDIAILSVDKDKIQSVALLGEADKLKVGDTVFAVGSPEGVDFAGSVTKGILSSKDRLVAVALSNNEKSDYYMKVIQLDAAINPGNSGGPICNIDGEVIGVANMKLIGSTVEGMGFAISIEDALDYASVLEKGEEIKRPFVGISMLDITDEYALWQNRVTIDGSVHSGVVVVEVSDNSPAAVAGLKKGDVIVAIDNHKVTSVAEFRYELYKYQIGKKINVKYVRKGKEKIAVVTLGENKESN